MIPEASSSLVCDGCHKQFHIECLKSGRPSSLEGDIFFNFKCVHCTGGEEELNRIKLQWLQVVTLALFNLHLSGNGKLGYFRWKEHICAYIDKHWLLLFGSHRRQTSLWYGTVAGTLSSGCPEYFLSGAKELGESGWWRLSEMKPPTLKLPSHSARPGRKKAECAASLAEPPVKLEGLRSRRGKTSIQAAMELKAKRETLLEAKDIRRARSQTRTAELSLPAPVEPSSSGSKLMYFSDTSLKKFKMEEESVSKKEISDSENIKSIKCEVTDSQIDSNEVSSAIGKSPDSFAGELVIKQEVDDESQFSLASSSSKSDSWWTEQDLRPNEILPSILTAEDPTLSDSDMEINPCCLTPPPSSPLSRTQSPTLHEILSSVQESGSESDDRDTDGESMETDDVKPRKRKYREESEPELPKITIPLMSLYEEKQLMKKLIAISETNQLPADLNRMKRKLIVRQLKRERGLPVFDIDEEMNRLTRGGSVNKGLDTSGHVTHGLSSRQFSGDVRILDRFQVAGCQVKAFDLHQPSFLNRLVGIEDCQLQSICSPYTTRVLKPFIRRDHELRPLKLRLLQEIKAYPHRNDPSWKPEPIPPLDYCYVRPQHIPSVNSLCRQFFWPGIDLSECLQYPDFSCVVLFRRIVIAFAFLVPDVKYNETYISFIFTHPEWRRAGIATFMLYHLIQTCMGKDLTLHVSATNPAMLLYQRFGFKPEEFILDFYDKYFPVDSKECKHAFFLRLRR